MRYIAQRLLTGEFLDWDVPINEGEGTRELSGPGGITGTIEPDLTLDKANDGRPVIEEWTTALYGEEEGSIRSAGLVGDLSFEGPQMQLDAPGFANYPNGQPFIDNYVPSEWPDPIDVFRRIWNHLQSFPNGDLGVTIGDESTWMRFGSGGGGPFRIFAYEQRDCGNEISSLVTTTPFDYLESHRWNGDRTAILHRIDPGFPRIGKRRADLRFADGENITDAIPVTRSGANFSNDVNGFGSGEGMAMKRARYARPDGRIRRATTHTDKMAGKRELDAQVRREYQERQLTTDIAEIHVKDHKNARLSQLDPGDDIFVETDLPWVGDIALWVRIVAVVERADAPEKAVLRVQRSDSFTYAPWKSPTGEPVPIS